MRNSLTIAFTMILIAGTAALASAEENVIRQHSFPATGITDLNLEHRVGTIRLEPIQGTDIEVELRITREKEKRWFRRATELDGLDMESRLRSDTLSLSFREKDVRTDWVIGIPQGAALSRLRIEAGVGTIEGTLPAVAANIELGVGSVDLKLSLDDTGEIELSAGVGDTSIRGASGSERRRAMVSSQTNGRGDGKLPVNVEVGVGDITVSLH